MQFIDLKSRHQLIGDKINARIQRVMEHGQFILGPEVREVEEKLAEYTGSKHCVTVSSGTDSLLIALMALGVGQGTRLSPFPTPGFPPQKSFHSLEQNLYLWIFVQILGIWMKPCLRQLLPIRPKQLCQFQSMGSVQIWMPSIHSLKNTTFLLSKMQLKVLVRPTKVGNPAIYPRLEAHLFFLPSRSDVMATEARYLPTMMSCQKSSVGFVYTDRNASTTIPF